MGNTDKNMDYWVKNLNLTAHKEGGYFKEVLRSDTTMETPRGARFYYTSIYFLLTHNNPSHFHRIQSDEVWYYHAGSPLTVHVLHPDGVYEKILVGPNIDNGEVLQAVVPKNVIFGSSVEVEGSFSVVSCMCSPGFDYRDFELFTKSELISQYPNHDAIINKLAYDKIPS
ncbi:cupin [Trypanosoma theileri]|uniref:Cupin n=1 Tax=Trypanosoma theileri TaxID=67003 RepID=A0A1X0NZ51_9TRYP|nr:cupin [Trypanosoma theileri]ORC89753.1 cupin [Trypanosoma theileri]